MHPVRNNAEHDKHCRQHRCFHKLPSNSFIQASIADLASSIFSFVGRPYIMLESAIPTLPRASLRAPPLDNFSIAARLAFLSVAKTAGLDFAVNSAFIAAFAAFATSNSSLML